MVEFEVGFSPCPNDTFMFHAWVHGSIDGAPAIRPWLADIEELNRRACDDPLSVTKLSAAAYAAVADTYRLSTAGAALGRGCGPLVVARDDGLRGDLAQLAGRRVAIPGAMTTAAFLFRAFAPPVELVETRFDRIVDAVTSGACDAGVVIHETRFTHAARGLRAVADLGELWESETGLPIPLGLIAVRRDVDEPARIPAAIRASIATAFASPWLSAAYVREHAHEMDADVCRRHIELYVNEHSVDVGSDGRRAVRELLRRNERECELDWIE